MLKAITALHFAKSAMRQNSTEYAHGKMTWRKQTQGLLGGLYRVKVLYHWNPGRITVHLEFCYGPWFSSSEKFDIFATNCADNKSTGYGIRIVNGKEMNVELDPRELRTSMSLINKAESMRQKTLKALRPKKTRLTFWDRFFIHHNNA